MIRGNNKGTGIIEVTASKGRAEELKPAVERERERALQRKCDTFLIVSPDRQQREVGG